MPTATLNLTVVSNRMLTKSQAAHYCGRPVKRFAIECPVPPLQFENGDERHDVHDLDGWLDRLKQAGGNDDSDIILAKL